MGGWAYVGHLPDRRGITGVVLHRKISTIHAGILLTLAVLALTSGRLAAQSDGLLRVYFLDVGQGDAALIETPDGKQILIDGGPDGAVVQKLGELISPYDRTLDALILSHPHADHITGFMDVLVRYDVERVVQSDITYDSSQFRAWQDAVASEGSLVVEAKSGTVLDLGNGVTLTVVYPLTSAGGVTTKDPHKFMTVAVLRYKNAAVMFTGDMEAPEEKRLMRNLAAELDVDVLKVGHHGSKTSTSDEFLAVTSPQAAVISVGVGNSYHLPSPEVLERIASAGIPYYRTDVDGDVVLSTDGEIIRITTDK